ncbi:alpha-(1,3)-fucosyltransferase C-like [Bombyx mandarina]|uniref:Fucosyltransferase n=2 Tax=Bombyx TaxID=7090 RepID=A0A8R2AKK1_BOMMO|nr:alpha-(1,3)-fucosyltransferase C [Bombyx mori]XP_012551720.1 alpha-(1,3)-fucosyltransferase C [Bombyx mori]XP_012551723.1 alpha-(1,3)-fucosyltransferase C [Bombyx mori]XP_028035374.1 alpha-(1,3)-fucosyltransferase C-like [Bombyx mandarina]XP_028035449.1 alpha-(1,3)-fucosyltransferase C-like [Bombyx mandarina]XP_028035532.1 alpha-(1,3)-fucosyltransferase C-like [Bombyx mandarina]XP_028035608.1 alpha-(1,3)-fucosyltransferase C-like [Bombyx mandarina]XP_037871234.1 alpha-(1,3)-fucosyltransfe
MPRCIQIYFPKHVIKHSLSIKFFFLVSCSSLFLSLVWIQLYCDTESSRVTASLVEEALENVSKDLRYSDVYRKTSKLPKFIKYILLWTRQDFAPFYFLGQGQRAFLKNNCSVINCYITTDRKFFGGDLTKFDGIAFNGRNMKSSDLPRIRTGKQKYVFFNMESAENFPVCSEKFDGFFNWTATYRLDSDIPFPYIQIRNINGEIVGPKKEMVWADDFSEIDEDLSLKIANKTKAAAWFVSNCKSKSGRKKFVDDLQRALNRFKYSIDIYGSCGKLKCPRDKNNDCHSLLEKDYYFYLSLENTFAEDYVTEKLLTALQHDVVPIVYGGANYSRFLPPGSYIDGRRYKPAQLAEIMNKLMKNHKLYAEYFRWKKHYTYHDPSEVDNVCALCKALNNKKMASPNTYYQFRKWWHPEFKRLC